MGSDVNEHFSVPVERQELDVLVYNLKENITKLSNLTQKIDESIKRDTTPCDIIDLSWLFQEKCKMLDNIKEDLLNPDCKLFTTEGEMYIDLYDTLAKENIQQKQTLENVTKELQLQEENLSKMKEFLHQIELNQKATATSTISTPEMLDVNLLFKNSAENMRTTRSNFHKLLDVSFENTNTKELIQDLTVAYFKGGDNKYINVADVKYSFSDIKMLKRIGLVVEDPYDNLRIKIDDIN